MIYLDNAATSAVKPEIVYRTLDEFTRHHSANAGRGINKESLFSVKAIVKTQDIVSELFNISSPQNIAFTPNATYALNFAILGTLSDGGHAVTTEIDHNSVLRPLNSLGNFTAVRADKQGYVSPFDIERAITPETKLIAVSHASNVCGTIQNIEAISRIAHDRKIKILIDTAQTAGILKIDNALLDADFIAFSGHKGLMGPLGTGGLYVKNPEELAPIITGGTGSSSEELIQPQIMPDMLHSGTVNTPAIAALGEGIKYVMSLGTEKILAHERHLAQLLRGELEKHDNITVYGSKDGIGTVAFNINGKGSEETAELFPEFAVRAGYHCAPLAHKALGTDKTGAVRVSFGVFNTETDVREFIKALSRI